MILQIAMRNAILVLLFIQSFAYSQQLRDKAPLFPVGFKSMFSVDLTRPSRSYTGVGRGVQINVRYPAAPSKSPSMTFADYIGLMSQEDSIGNASQAKEIAMSSFLSELNARGADINSWKEFLAKAKPMTAIRNARFLENDYPIILLIHGSAANHSFMGEFLASHGMVVISVPYKGYLQNAFDVNVLGMETEIRDHEYALSIVVRGS